MTAPFRLSVEECYQSYGDLKECRSGAHGIAALNTSTDPETKAVVTVADGVITVVPTALNKGLNQQHTYILTPSISQAGNLIWHTSGGAVEQGLAD